MSFTEDNKRKSTSSNKKAAIENEGKYRWNCSVDCTDKVKILDPVEVDPVEINQSLQ